MARTKNRDLSDPRFTAWCKDQNVKIFELSYPAQLEKYDDWQESLAGTKRTHTKRTCDLAIVVTHDSRDVILHVMPQAPIPGTRDYTDAIDRLRSFWDSSDFASKRALVPGATNPRIVVLAGTAEKLGEPAFSPVPPKHSK